MQRNVRRKKHETSDDLASLLDLIRGSETIVSPNEGPAIVALGRMIRLVTRMRHGRSGVAEQVGLHAGDVDILYLLQRSMPEARLRTTDLSAMLAVTPGGISKRIDRLEAAGLVRRGDAQGDRRAMRIIPTERGLAVARQARELNRSPVIDVFGPDEWAQLDDLLRRLSEAYTRIDTGGSADETA